MLKKLYLITLILLFSSTAYAHKLVLGVIDNEDNTITVTGVFDTGAPATGAWVILKSEISGEIIFKKRLPDESEITTKIPDEPYEIILDGGPGHKHTMDGIPPVEGFTKKIEANDKVKKKKAPSGKMMNLPYLITTGIGFLLLLITIIVSIKNTNRLIDELKKS